MISYALSIISSLFWAAGKLFELLYSRQLVDAGRTQAELEALRKQVQDAQIAIAAREAVRAHIDRNSEWVPDDKDPFNRDNLG